MHVTRERTIGSQLDDPGSIISTIGNTPLIRIRSVVGLGDSVEVYAKAEWFNPGGSVKDRAALNMLYDAERSGRLDRDKSLIDATSGNTGIAYAMIGKAMGYRVALVVPENASEERKRTLRAYGVELIFTDPMEGTDGSRRGVQELVANNPDQFVYLDQYNNPANWRAHYKTTAEEIWRQTDGRITHFVAGLGTTGTFVGTSRRLKELNPRIQCISFQPDSPLHGIEGLKHLRSSIIPGIYDESLADGQMIVSTEEAVDLVRRLAREEGLFVGTSSGAAMAACSRIARERRSGVIVTVFPDGGEKYLSEFYWQDQNG